MVGLRKISTLIIGAFGIFAFAAGLSVVVGVQTLSRYAALTDEVDLDARRLLLVERLNGMIAAAVMESRGVYLSANARDSERYVETLLIHLDEIATTVSQWQAIKHNKDEAVADMAIAQVDRFVLLNRELARRAREGGPAAASELGNTDDNRADLQALTVSLQKAMQVKRDRMAIADANRDQLERSSLWQHAGGSGLLIVVGLLLALLVVHRRVARPLRHLAATMNRLAQGEDVVAIPSVLQRDEIGDMARSVAVFHETALARAALEHDMRMQDAARLRRQARREEITA